jgi:hypothetical protein
VRKVQAAHRPGRQLGAALDDAGGGLLPGGGADIHARDRARGKGAQVVRVQHLEQRFGEFGIVVVEALGDARVEQREGFDHALDVRVFAHFAADQEAAGDLRIALGEVAQVAAQVAQFALVVRQHLFQLRLPPAWSTPVPDVRPC